MKTHEQLKQAIEESIKTNGSGTITGEILQKTLLHMVDELGVDTPQIIEWDESSTLDEYVVPGTYICDNGSRTNVRDGLPIDNTGDNARFGFTLVVTQATSNENGNHHQIVGQTLVLTNRLGNETKQYSRSLKYTINNDATPPEVTDNTWSNWKELQGTTYLGQVTKAQLDAVIDNGIYTGVVTDNELLPQGSTFTMLVMNNYAVNSAVGMPEQARQVSQIFFALPLSDVSTGAILSQGVQMLQRTGTGSDILTWQAGHSLTKIRANRTDYVNWNIDLYPDIYLEDEANYSPLINVVTSLTRGFVKGKIFRKIGSSISQFKINNVSFNATVGSKILPGKGYEEITIMKFENETRLIRSTYPTNNQ